MFNSLAVVGIAALVHPSTITDTGLTVVAAGAMVAASVLALGMLITGRHLTKREAIVLIVSYCVALPFTF